MSWSAEIAVGAVLAAVLPLVLGVQLGRAAAYVVCGTGWVFPDDSDLFTGLPGILTGDPAAGLVDAPTPAPTGSLLAGSVVAAELVVTVAAVVLVRFCWLRWGPGRLPGAATRTEAALLLGPQRLRRAAAVSRPDLHRRARR